MWESHLSPDSLASFFSFSAEKSLSWGWTNSNEQIVTEGRDALREVPPKAVHVWAAAFLLFKHNTFNGKQKMTFV